MSFQEKTIIASALAILIVLAIFYPRVQASYSLGEFNGPEGLMLLGKTGLYFIGASIIANITLIILLTILQAILTGGEKPNELVDERDKIIERRGMQIFGIVSGMGIIAAMVALTVGYAAVPVFFIIILGFALAEFISSIAKLAMFRLGW